MRPVNAVILSGSDAAGVTGLPISTAQVFAASFQIWASDVVAGGTITIQASNEVLPDPTKWTLVTTSTVTAGVGTLINLPQMAYKFIRALYTSTAPGTGTIEVYMSGFGI